ncbi:MAG: chemotaxis protein CheW [Planctomycetes bacterium]|nr:chemotaxis protein CheW [Planctomycetota bacterium]
MTHATISHTVAADIARPAPGRAYLVFILAGQRYALPASHVREVLALPELARPAGMPPLLAGYVRIGATVIPVLSLARLLGVADTELGLFTPLLILNVPDRPLTLLVDQADEIVSLTPGQLTPINREQSFNDCSIAVASVKERTVIILDPERLLSEQESRRLAELDALARERMTTLSDESS